MWQATLGAFINDVKLYHKGDPTEIIEKLQELASQDLQLWKDLLWAAGGKINFKKTKTYTRIMKWFFNPDGKPFMMPQLSYQPIITEPPEDLNI